MHTPPLSEIHQACASAGRFMITEGSDDPRVVLLRLLEALAVLAPDTHPAGAGFAAFPEHAMDDGKSPWWSSPEGEAAVWSVIETLNEHAPEGFALMPAQDWLDLGFFPLEQTLYHTLLVPFSKTPTEWHPTEATGPWSLLTRGNFDSVEEADAWAAARLGGEPYSVRTMRKLDGETVSEHPRPSGVVPTEEPEECEDNACAGCAWCDRHGSAPVVVDPPFEDEREWDDATMGGRDQFEGS